MNKPNVCEMIQREIGKSFTSKDNGDLSAGRADYQRTRTPYLIPDGDNIDLFFRLEADGVTVTDSANTTRWSHPGEFVGVLSEAV